MKLGVCVPYRNREEHLKVFIPEVTKYLESRGIDFCMYFCNQADDKLFNRGATKNIAAKFAFEDGCDYIVWHDIDMIPEEGGGADYSYPVEHPVHIATNISQMDYKLKYFEYFGGAVLFTKEQVDRTNGYSNEYWDWGMEDDDLFWRCYLEKLVDVKRVKHLQNHPYLCFTGQDSYCKILLDKNPDLRRLTYKSHTIHLLCRAFQQPEKTLPYLIGDKGRKYVEYPILIVPGYDYGVSFNNSKAYSLQFWNAFNAHHYLWAKRYDRQWTYVTATFDATLKEARLYINGKEVSFELGEGSQSPLSWSGRLKNYGDQDFYLGTTPSVPRSASNRFLKGDIADVQIFDTALTPEEVQNLVKTGETYDIEALKFSLNKGTLERINVEKKYGDIDIEGSVLPFRKAGRFRCLPHEDEGIVGGRFKKGETTARNERRYQLEMQQGKVNYKKDGIVQVKFELLGIDQLTPKAKMINVKL